MNKIILCTPVQHEAMLGAAGVILIFFALFPLVVYQWERIAGFVRRMYRAFRRRPAFSFSIAVASFVIAAVATFLIIK